MGDEELGLHHSTINPVAYNPAQPFPRGIGSFVNMGIQQLVYTTIFIDAPFLIASEESVQAVGLPARAVISVSSGKS